jgi:hypothetical protein
VRSSLPEPAGVLYVVSIGIVAVCVAGSVACVLVSSNSTVVAAPGASVPYGLAVASAVKAAGSSAGSWSRTSPVCGEPDRLRTSTGTVIVSPMPIDCAAGERPTRSASGAVCASQLSYSSHLPQRSKRPSTGDTIRTTSSV